jgi:large subunit ribosomal protein L6e
VSTNKFYPADDVVVPKASRTRHNKPCKLRRGIAPGSVLILLAGRFRGKRVVFLKQLESGLLLVSGPFSVNGVPLRRVAQGYVIPTSSSVSMDGVDVSGVSDSFFQRAQQQEESKEEQFTAEKKKHVPSEALTEDRRSVQQAVDTALLKNIEGVELMRQYLRSTFSLRKGDKPHLMKF